MNTLICERVKKNFPCGKSFLIKNEREHKNQDTSVAFLYVDSNSYTITWKSCVDFSDIEEVALNVFANDSRTNDHFITDAQIAIQNGETSLKRFKFYDSKVKRDHDNTISRYHNEIVFARYEIKGKTQNPESDYSFSADKINDQPGGITEIGIKFKDRKKINTFLLEKILQNSNNNKAALEDIDIETSIGNIHECLR